ncbi:hypothetical protein F6X40_10230 [Paraburkholderia sp. UCT31]|uniref:queuosine salvage family protein n=1 Tax=Paraburkholderia sp. UCT31 TaxID=2615209 RepID=UPI001655C92A|nr:queuosine salvage family protein [Paraburkholderia sp. UCT31]MBC8737185.1 hypothetical protein [Paraburkholderia sp. UCT31]
MTREDLIQRIALLHDATLVEINHDAIGALNADFSTFYLPSAGVPFEVRDPVMAARYLIAQTALQYRFWDGSGAAFRRYSLGGQVGTRGMELGFSRAWGMDSSEGPGIFDCARSVEAVESFFGDIPDAPSRKEILAGVLLSGSLQDVVSQLDHAIRSGEATVREAQLLADAFPVAYGDPFLKKALLAVSLLGAQYRAAGVSVSQDLLCFADYQLPSVLRHLGVLEYAPSLAVSVGSRQLLARGGSEENSIRAATVVACEAIAQRFKVSAAEVDWFLWRQRKAPTAPFHLTTTTAY